jgi:hypothetical protein
VFLYEHFRHIALVFFEERFQSEERLDTLFDSGSMPPFERLHSRSHGTIDRIRSAERYMSDPITGRGVDNVLSLRSVDRGPFPTDVIIDTSSFDAGF